MRLQRQSTNKLLPWTSRGAWRRCLQYRKMRRWREYLSRRTQKLVAMLANPPENPTAGRVTFYCLAGWPAGKRLVAMPKGCAKCSHGWLPDAACKGMHPWLLQSQNPPPKCPFFNYTYLHALHVIWLPLLVPCMRVDTGDVNEVQYSRRWYCTSDAGRHWLFRARTQ